MAVALDRLGQILGELVDQARPAGYIELEHWVSCGRSGDELVFGIEGAGSWGAGLCQHLQHAGHTVVEVERPRRQDRRRGKSDRIDALMAAKKVLAKDGLSTPRAGGTRQALAALLIAQRSCVSERTRLLNQLQALHTTAPVALRERIGQAPANSSSAHRRCALAKRRRREARAIFGVLRDLAGALSARSQATRNATNTSSPSSSARSTRRCSTRPASARSPRPSSWSATPGA